MNKTTYLIFSLFSIYLLITSFIYSLNTQPKGDELHYLVTSKSIVNDKDIWLENNYDNKDYSEYFTGNIDRHSVKSKDNHEYLYHGLGLFPFLISPGFKILGKTGSILTISIISCLFFIYLYSFLKKLSSPKAALTLTIILGLTLPLSQYSFLLFPEIVGAFLILFSYSQIISSTKPSFLTLVSIGLLPWIHLRFITVAFAFTILWGYKLIKQGQKNKLIKLLIPLILIGFYFLFLKFIYGSFDPTAPYRQLNIPTDSGNMIVNFINMLIDRQYGLLTHNPIFLFAISGLYFWYKKSKNTLFISLFASLFYLFPTLRYYDWHGGYSAPARYLVPILPLVIPGFIYFFNRQKSIFFYLIFLFFTFWGFLAYFTNLLLAPNHGFVYKDGVSPYLWFIYQVTGFNIHQLFPSFFPKEQINILHYFWISLVFIFTLFISITKPYSYLIKSKLKNTKA